jgi:hypothetical protein
MHLHEQHGSDSGGRVSQLYKEKQLIDESSKMLDELEESGTGISSSLYSQNSMLRNAAQRVTSIANSMALSRTIIRAIERRSQTDRYIMFAGFALILLFLLILWLR